MEGKSGFKECPRCGLRNRISAARCDFCGYEFKASTEEWSDYVDVLEKLSKSDEGRGVDEEISKKIESTMIKTEIIEDLIVRRGEKISIPQESPLEARDAGNREMSGVQEIEEQEGAADIRAFVGSMIEQETGEASPEGSKMEDAIKEEPFSATKIIPEQDEHFDRDSPTEVGIHATDAVPQNMTTSSEEGDVEVWRPTSVEGGFSRGPMEEVAADQVKEESAVIEAMPHEETAAPLEQMSMAEVHHAGTGSNRPFLMAMGIGAVLYLAVISLALMRSLDPVLGWIVVIAGAVLITIGLGRLHRPLFAVDTDELIGGS